MREKVWRPVAHVLAAAGLVYLGIYLESGNYRMAVAILGTALVGALTAILNRRKR